MMPGRTWRRTTIERNSQLVPLADDWSLWDAAIGLAIGRIHAYPDGRWRCVCRSVDSNVLKDSITRCFKTSKQSKEFAEAQTQGQHYVVKRKRTKEEILRRAGVR